MKIINDKSLILNEIKFHYGFKNDYQFAEFLDIKPSTLANWHKRNTFDLEKIFSKCENINANWLLSGEGEMMISKKKVVNEYCQSEQPFFKVTEEENHIDNEEVFYKEKYILLLERYNTLLENKLKEYINQIEHIVK